MSILSVDVGRLDQPVIPFGSSGIHTEKNCLFSFLVPIKIIKKCLKLPVSSKNKFLFVAPQYQKTDKNNNIIMAADEQNENSENYGNYKVEERKKN